MTTHDKGSAPQQAGNVQVGDALALLAPIPRSTGDRPLWAEALMPTAAFVRCLYTIPKAHREQFLNAVANQIPVPVGDLVLLMRGHRVTSIAPKQGVKRDLGVWPELTREIADVLQQAREAATTERAAKGTSKREVHLMLDRSIVLVERHTYPYGSDSHLSLCNAVTHIEVKGSGLRQVKP